LLDLSFYLKRSLLDKVFEESLEVTSFFA